MCAVLIFYPKVNAMQTYPFYSSGCLTVRFAGELDHAAAAGAMRAVAAAAEEFLPRRCVLDLSGLTFMDSSGVAVILRAERLLSAFRAELLVADPPEQARRVLELAGMSRLLVSADSDRKEVTSF